MQQSVSPEEARDSAIAELYQCYALALYTYLRLQTVSSEDAEDLLVETFLAACENSIFHELPQERQRLWLWRVARYKVIDYYRTRRQMVNVDNLSNELYDSEELAPEVQAIRSEEYIRLREHVQNLPPLQQQILRLRFVQDMRCNEIARQLGKSDTAVRMLLSRTLQLLRSIYRNHEDRGHD